MTRRSTCAAAFAVAVLAASPAYAQDKMARADQLFNEGTAALDEHRFDIACPKLAESRALDPSALGTLVNLARCHEESGRTGTAYAEYAELEHRAAERKQPERVALAKKHRAALETRLSRVDLSVQAAVDGELVTIDAGTPLPTSKLPKGQPFDPGDHAIEASAPGKATYRSKFTVLAGPSTTNVIVPALADAATATTTPAVTPTAPAPPPTTTTTTPESGASPQKTLGLVGMGVGAAGLVTGAIFGSIAIAKKSSVSNACPTIASCPSNTFLTAQGDYNTAHTAATVSTIAFIAGGVFVAAGAALYFTAPTGRVEVAPTAGPNAGGASLRAVF